MTIDDYIAGLNAHGREWMEEFLAFMAEVLPDLEPRISFGMPMYVLGSKMNDKGYIAFSVAKEHFTIHLHPRMKGIVPLVKEGMPEAAFGKGCIKVRFDNTGYKPLLQEMIKKVLEDVRYA